MWAELGIGGSRANGSVANGAHGARPGHAHRGAGEGASAMSRVLDVARELLARGRS
jgi:hypothetical protein